MQDEIHQKYLTSLSKNLDEINELSQQFSDGDPLAEKKIRMIAHSLHGSGAVFGYPQISVASQIVENSPKNEIIKSLVHLILVLKLVIENPEKQQKKSAPDNLEKNRNHEDVTTILLIDDDQQSSNLVKDAITKAMPKYTVDLAENGKIAQEKIVKNNYCLVVLDLILPDWDGREILRQLRQEFKLTLPVIVLSAVTKDVIRIECMGLGADKMLEKPFEMENLINSIDALLKKHAKLELSLVPIGDELKPKETPPAKINFSADLKSILVVEDDVMQAELITHKLAEQGLRVNHVTNGREAMVALRTDSYSLVILDVKMPVLNGFEVLERIRGELGLKDLPVIMLTAMGEEADIIKGYDMGVDDYILKPFSVVQLIARVKSLIKKTASNTTQ